MNNYTCIKKKILAVDDDKVFLELIQIWLERNGYEVITAFDGQEALVKIKSEKPDAIILDIGLPIINGEEVCRNIRNDYDLGTLPVIMLTGRTTDVDRIVGKVIGAEYYMTKPFDIQELLEKAKNILLRTSPDLTPGGAKP